MTAVLGFLRTQAGTAPDWAADIGPGQGTTRHSDTGEGIPVEIGSVLIRDPGRGWQCRPLAVRRNTRGRLDAEPVLDAARRLPPTSLSVVRWARIAPSLPCPQLRRGVALSFGCGPAHDGGLARAPELAAETPAKEGSL